MPDVDDKEIQAVSQVIASKWLTTGPKVREFERVFAEYVGAQHAIAVNSATAAMHLALEASGIQSGDEVIVPTFTFAATAEVVRYFDAVPRLVDVDSETFNIDPAQIEAAITDKTKAIIPVHVGGQAADLDPILTLARQYHLTVVEDAAHALPTYYKDHMVGTIGDFTTYSFYATKTLATGEGGMITTDNEEWATRCRIMSLHGISKDAWKRYTSEGSWYYEIIAPGFKYNMTDIAAAIGLVQLAKLEGMNMRRQEIAVRYDEAFATHPALAVPYRAPYSTHPFHLYVLRLNLEALQIDRNSFIEKMRALNIGTSVHWIPLHMHPYYRERYGFEPQAFPIAHQLYQRIISLPIYSAMTDSDVDYVIDAVLHVANMHQV